MLLRSAILVTWILQPRSEAFLEKLFRKQNSCDCPCRTLTVRRCIESYEDRCEASQYSQYNNHCYRHRLLAARNVTETECQVCRHFTETEMVDSFKW